MITAEIINDAKDLVADKMSEDTSGHDFYHVERVVKLALHIGAKENVTNIALLELIAWLHDMIDTKLVVDKNEEKHALKKWLTKRIPASIANEIMVTVGEIGFKGGNMQASNMYSKIVNDADKLDAMGAVGIARCFAFGAHKKQLLFHPNISAKQFHNEKDYRELKSTSFNHIYEKLLKLKDYMYTKTAKSLAQERHQFLLQFVKQFNQEIGEAN